MGRPRLARSRVHARGGNIRYRGCTAVAIFARLDSLFRLVAPEAWRSGLARRLSWPWRRRRRRSTATSPRILMSRSRPDARSPASPTRQASWSLACTTPYRPRRRRVGSARRDAGRPGGGGDRASIARFGARVRHRVAMLPQDPKNAELCGALTQGRPRPGSFMRPVAGWGRHATPIADFISAASNASRAGTAAPGGWRLAIAAAGPGARERLSRHHDATGRVRERPRRVLHLRDLAKSARILTG